ncbi:MAG: hypothetical protein IJE44_03475 [Clostridia bacterium]|nr:hypothetical protein [Clostridia bacterium]MBQ6895011.1 hypothetical protein [Clostridia bacterium]
MMEKATKEVLAKFEELAERRIAEIRNTKDEIKVSGAVYYVSTSGNDDNDGKTPQTPWKSLEKVSTTELNPGDGVCFKRGDVFRGAVATQSEVTYFAYGEGEKPKFYGWDRSLSNPSQWTLFDKDHNIWKLNEEILDCGTLVFNDGEAHCRKLIPSYRNGMFVCREDENKPFIMADEMTEDLDLFCDIRVKWSDPDGESKGESFLVPIVDLETKGDLYLRCDKGNPGEVFDTIEAVAKRTIFSTGRRQNVHIDNVCIKYANFGVTGGMGTHVTNSEIGWIGGTIQHYFGTDPNYPQGRRGSVTRYGNAIECYGACNDYVVDNCYFYQQYDAAVTHQITTNGKKYELKNIRYSNNVIDTSVYSVEYFLNQTMGDTESYIENCEICGNIMTNAGCGWGQQRHNTHTPAHIKGWSYTNTARNFSIHDNIFYKSAYRIFHIVAEEETSLPTMYNNTYVQKYGMTLGQYGSNKEKEPEIVGFYPNAEEFVQETMGDKDAKVYYIE